MVTSTITHHGEPTFQYAITASGACGVHEDIAGQLSLPISSYKFYNTLEGLSKQHQDSYSIRLTVCTVFLFMSSEVNLSQNAKGTIEQFKDNVKYLKEAEMHRQKISIYWEIHSCIAQGAFPLFQTGHCNSCPASN